MAIAGKRISFNFDWRTTAFTLVMMPLLVTLGFWQLQRAQEKALIGAAWELRQSQPPKPLAAQWDETPEALAFTPVKLSGELLKDKYFLLDNRIQQGRFGYEVLSIMQLDDDAGLALVNRGWLAADPSRLKLPPVPPVDGRIELTGHVYVAPGEPYLLAEQQLGEEWPKLLQAIEMEKIMPLVGQINGQRVFPYPIRIAAGEPAALTVDW